MTSYYLYNIITICFDKRVNVLQGSKITNYSLHKFIGQIEMNLLQYWGLRRLIIVLLRLIIIHKRLSNIFQLKAVFTFYQIIIIMFEIDLDLKIKEKRLIYTNYQININKIFL